MDNIIENNKLIADFMGVDYSGNLDYMLRIGLFIPFTENCLNYHNSWDWLMPVVEKINELDGHLLITLWDKYNIDRFNLTDTLDKCIKDEVYDLCVMYIKWYNETFQIQQ